MQRRCDLTCRNDAPPENVALAEALESRNVPFILLTGYGDKAIPDDRPHWQAHSKPYESEEFVKILVTITTSKGEA